MKGRPPPPATLMKQYPCIIKYQFDGNIGFLLTRCSLTNMAALGPLPRWCLFPAGCRKMRCIQFQGEVWSEEPLSLYDTWGESTRLLTDSLLITTRRSQKLLLSWDPVYQHELTLISIWISNYIHLYVVWNYLSIPKLQRYNRWSLGMDKYFHPILY